MSKSNAAKRKKQARARAAARVNVPRSTTGGTRSVPARAVTTADAFDQWLTSLWTLRIACVTLAFALCVAALFAFLLNGREHAQHTYESAQVCMAESTGDCVILLDATITGKTKTGGKSPPQYLITLDGPAPASGQITMLEAPIWDGMNIGDSVTASVWSGQVVRVTDGAISGDTSEAPSIQTATVEAIFASSIAWVVTAALFAVRVFEAGRGRALGWSRVLIPVNLPAGLSVFLFPFGSLAGATSGSSILVAVLGGVGLSALAGSYFVVNWFRKRHERVEVT